MIRNRYILIVCAMSCCLSAIAQNVTWTIKPEYDAISVFSEGVATVMKNGKWGYVSDQGTEILAPAYDLAYPFSEGMGVLASNEQSLLAIVDRSGKLTHIRDRLQIDSRFATFSDGLLLVAKGKKWGYINKDGQQAIDCKYDIAQPFSEGLAAAVLDRRQCYCWYYMDATGKAIFHLSDLKKDIYWALGFHDGKAMVLHSKGALFIDKTGQEIKGNLPQITPPEEAAGYSKPALVCKEGLLTFDEKCRAVSFVAKNGKETEFISSVSKPRLKPEHTIIIDGAAPAAEDIRWLSPSAAVVKAGNSKYGLLAFYDTPVLSFSLSSDTLASVFGSSEAANLNIRNTSPVKLEKVDIRINDKSFETASLASGSAVSYPLLLNKETDNEIETKNIVITAYDNGLQIGESKKAVYIKDLPSLSISVPVNKVTLQLGQDAYTVKVQVKNLSDVQVDNVAVTIDRQTQRIASLSGKETGIVQFTFAGSKETVVKTLYISAKAPNTPAVTANARITIDVPLPPPPTF